MTRFPLRLAWALVLLAVSGGVASCTAVSAARPRAVQPGSVRPSAVRPSAVQPSAVQPGSQSASGPAATPSPADPRPARAWIAISRVRAGDGSLITLAVFHGPARYVLHDGSQDPGKLAGHVTADSKVTGPERGRLLAAFNGGFKIASHAGGYEQEGHVARRLQWGLASLVIGQDGQARIGVWGQDVPAPGERLYTVRQNLWPLVSNGIPTAETALWWRWGGTVGGREYVARSALGQDTAGDLLYAASMSTTPADLAEVLADNGAAIAMELDINPEWVQFDAAKAPGAPLRAEIPGQNRPAAQYLTGWTRDFITVLAPG